MSAKMTPGPWYWVNNWANDVSNPEYTGAMGCLEPRVLWYGFDGTENIYCPNEADARAIAAVPDLIAALQAITELTSRQQLPLTTEIHSTAINALVKAGAL